MSLENEEKFEAEKLSPPGKLSKKEKWGFLGLIFLAIIIVFLGFKQIGNTLKMPFALFALKYSNPNAPLEKNENQLLAELKTKDTDQDGLSDYDELYIYQTSPYLPDTDSDGLSDKQEIEAGSNPNCPQGKECGAGGAAASFNDKFVTSTLPQPVAEIPSAAQMLMQSVLGNKPTPQALREFLISQGADKTILEKFSDEELAALFKEFITSPTSTAAAVKLPLEKSGELKDSASNLLPNVDLGQIRESLRQKGVSEEALKKISDEQLLEALKGL
ncbi:MAG: hypothetical protein HY982_02795 [Candidatus Magasanikbacteria bacterium]|nr:hypothetical protein [Candidatus Magasanikbacteria bacterium]